MKQLHFKNREKWRNWLSQNHAAENELWLIFYKKATGQPCIAYGASVEEALCFGWIDSIIKKIDDAKYARKFTPRKNESNWSELNRKRANKMIKEKRMTEAGLSKIQIAKKTKRWDRNTKPKTDFGISPEFANALDKNPQAKENFENLALTYRKQYIGWINVAKKSETKKQRIAESIALLQKGEKLGLK
jgi:uncharacterized protein YdeI (YjbR/CyaY-like superfamily)